jgi:hypothetical protein
MIETHLFVKGCALSFCILVDRTIDTAQKTSSPDHVEVFYGQKVRAIITPWLTDMRGLSLLGLMVKNE